MASSPTAAAIALDPASGLAHHDPLLDDVQARHERLISDRVRLFSTDISIDVMSVAGGVADKKTYTDGAEFEAECLLRPPRGSRYYTLKPSRPKVVSRCPLHVTEEVTRKLMGTHKVMPSFLDHLHAYGRREKREQDASFGGGRYKLGFAGDSVSEYELCYTVKFAVNNGRLQPDSPYLYSIRQTSVYQKFRCDQNESVGILVQPSESAQTRFAAAATEFQGNPLKLHLVFFSASNEGWRDQYNHLEKIFYETTMAATNFAIQRNREQYVPGHEGEGQGPLQKFKVDFNDVQDLQRFEELLRAIKTALEINEDSIKSLQALNNKLHKMQGTSLAFWSEVDIEAEQQLAKISRHKRNFQALLKNVHGRAQLLYNVLDFNNSLLVANTSQRALDIRSLQAGEQAMMAVINEMSIRDNVGVKILTLLATLYVPASFVASFLSGGIVTFQESRSDKKGIDFRRMVTSPEATIFYITFTVVLMALTYGCWWVWKAKAQKQVDNELHVSRVNSFHMQPSDPEKRLARLERLETANSTNVPPLSMVINSSRSPMSPPMSPVLSPLSDHRTNSMPPMSERRTNSMSPRTPTATWQSYH